MLLSFTDVFGVDWWWWFSMGYILRRHPVWWANYNYLLAMALACGVAFQGLVMAFAFNMPRVDFPYVESFSFFVCLLSRSREKERKREKERYPQHC